MKKSYAVPLTFSVSCLVAAMPAAADILGVSFIPPWPVPGNHIVARVEGQFPHACWNYQSAEVSRDGNEVLITVLAFEEGEICLPAVLPYSFQVDLGVFEAGSYRLTVEDPLGSFTTEIQVQAVVDEPICDSNGDGTTDLSDAVHLLQHLFVGGPAPVCPAHADANGDGTTDLSDAIHLLSFLFLGGDPPAAHASCRTAVHCASREWTVKCYGHWSCACGECRPVCGEGCGDGACDIEGGETPASCPGDCAGACKPFCDKIGTRSEGWYDSCTRQLFDWAFCADCEAECRNAGTKSEGWYDSCTGELITYGDCDGKP
jgi:hypothetical protein